MGRMKPKDIAPGPTSLVASAARIRAGANISTPIRNSTADWWHEQAWDYYHKIGEFRYACDWIGGMLSKAIIYATVETSEGVQKVTDGPIIDYIGALFGNADGKAEMLRLVGIHLSVTGECYLVGYEDNDEFGDGGDKWQVAASTKCNRPTAGGQWVVNDVTIDRDPEDVSVIRIWRADPLDPQVSISPALAVLSTLRELHKLSQHVAAQVDSRLAGAGILMMPDTMTFPPPPVETDADGNPVETLHKTANNAEDLMAILMEAMKTSIANRDSASALVPIVVTAPKDAIEYVKHLTFWSDLDEHAIELRKEAIGRLALGMDVPPEVLQGAADSNHWSAWQADESAIKAHAEPLLKLITTALGSHYLRPLLKDDPHYTGERLSAYSVAADTSEMRLRPNRSKEALELHDRGVLSDEALVRETGFDDTDMMDDDQRKLWLLRKLAQGSTTPEFAEAAAKALGIILDVVRPEATENDGEPARPTPSLLDHPENSIPDQEVSGRRKQAREEGRVPSSDVERKASLLAACDMLVLRALERAGNRLKNKTGAKFNLPASELHTVVASTDADDLLADAWGYVPLVAKRYGTDPEALTQELQQYTGHLIAISKPHTYAALEAFMTRELAAA